MSRPMHTGKATAKATMLNGRSGTEPARAVVPAPMDYHAFLLEVPRVRDEDMEGLLRYRLRSEYPGAVDSLALSYHRMGDGAVLVLAMEESTLQEYRRLAAGARIYTAETIALLGRGLSEVTIESDRWCLELACSPFVRLVHTGGREGESPGGHVSLSELAEGPLPGRLQDFALKRRSRRVWWAVRVAASGFACLALATVLIVRDVRALRNAEESELVRYRGLVAQMEDANATLARAGELEAALDALPQPAGPAPYEVLVALADVAAGSVTISSLSIRGREVELRGCTFDPLRFADLLSSDLRFESIRLVRAQPGVRGGQRFSLRGVFAP